MGRNSKRILDAARQALENLKLKGLEEVYKEALSSSNWADVVASSGIADRPSRDDSFSTLDINQETYKETGWNKASSAGLSFYFSKSSDSVLRTLENTPTYGYRKASGIAHNFQFTIQVTTAMHEQVFDVIEKESKLPLAA